MEPYQDFCLSSFGLTFISLTTDSPVRLTHTLTHPNYYQGLSGKIFLRLLHNHRDSSLPPLTPGIKCVTFVIKLQLESNLPHKSAALNTLGTHSALSDSNHIQMPIKNLIPSPKNHFKTRSKNMAIIANLYYFPYCLHLPLFKCV